MIIFDTNLISEITKEKCDPVVWDWSSQQVSEDSWTTSINIAELLTGVALLSDGRRKSDLEIKLNSFVNAVFDDRILSFDAAAARQVAIIISAMKLKGEAISLADAQIAAIAATHNCAVATRDARPFYQAGLQVINPWGMAP